MKAISAIALLTFFTTASCLAAEVKGLKVGAPTTPQDLADRFGSVDCPNDLVAKTMLEMGIKRCTVPMSYLGVQTSADVYLVNGLAASVSIKMPQTFAAEINALFVQRYGPSTPNVRAPGCAEWLSVESSNLKLCTKGGSTSITYSYAAPKQLDPSDI